MIFTERLAGEPSLPLPSAGLCFRPLHLSWPGKVMTGSRSQSSPQFQIFNSTQQPICRDVDGEISCKASVKVSFFQRGINFKCKRSDQTLPKLLIHAEEYLRLVGEQFPFPNRGWDGHRQPPLLKIEQAGSPVQTIANRDGPDSKYETFQKFRLLRDSLEQRRKKLCKRIHHKSQLNGGAVRIFLLHGSFTAYVSRSLFRGEVAHGLMKYFFPIGPELKIGAVGFCMAHQASRLPFRLHFYGGWICYVLPSRPMARFTLHIRH
jgi:hypothetical protein